MKTTRAVSILALLLLIISCNNNEKKQPDSRVNSLPYYNEATFTPKWLNSQSDKLSNFHKIPDFELYNQNGDTITEKTVGHKIYVADFFFTSCPGICPKMTANMELVQNEFLNDSNIILLSHSVTPEKDSIATLQRFAKIKKVNSNKWHLLTGKRKVIYDLGRKSYFAEEDLGIDKTDADFLHTENFILVDKNRHIRGIYNGLNKTAIQQLITDIHTLKKEK